MKWAVISSLIIHGVIFGFILKNTAEKSDLYPSVIRVHLASPPPVKGVEKPAAQKSESKSKIIKPDGPDGAT